MLGSVEIEVVASGSGSGSGSNARNDVVEFVRFVDVTRAAKIAIWLANVVTFDEFENSVQNVDVIDLVVAFDMLEVVV